MLLEAQCSASIANCGWPLKHWGAGVLLWEPALKDTRSRHKRPLPLCAIICFHSSIFFWLAIVLHGRDALRMTRGQRGLLFLHC